MTIQDRRYTERKAAGGALLRLIAEAGWRNQKNTTIGTIGGFDLAIGLSRDLRMRVTEAVLIMQCDNRQRIELPDEPTPLGVIARLENALDRFENDQRERGTPCRRPEPARRLRASIGEPSNSRLNCLPSAGA